MQQCIIISSSSSINMILST